MIRAFVKSSFFKQGAWVSFAAFAGGGGMMLAQIVAGGIKGEYLLFLALLDIVGQLAIPTLGIQAAMAHQTASAESPAARQSLAANARAVFYGVALLWAFAAVLTYIFNERLLSTFEINTAAALPITLVAGLIGMATPIVGGMLQGKQDFVWYGWATLLNGFVRVGAIAIAVLWLGGKAASAMAAVLIGSLFTFALMAVRTYDLWSIRGGNAEVFRLIRRIIPVSLMIGVPTFLFTYDSIIVKSAFSSADDYGAARLIGRTLVFITTPMVYVMFPKIVQSAARSERSTVLLQTLGVTALVGGLAAATLTMVPWLPLKVLWGTKFASAEPLVPWFAWTMLPLAVAHVLINNLLARERFAALPWLVAVAVGYGVTLHFRHETFTQVITTLGTFSTLLVAVCVVFTVRKSGK